MITSISQNGINFIKRCEGFKPQVYSDNGKPAIAYGHDLLPGESFPDGIDEANGTLLLINNVAKLYPTLAKLAPQANQNQFDALCSFGYNLGITKLEKMLSHGFRWVPTQMPRWCYKEVAGVMVKDPGLVARRAEEVALFKS
jgi:GH24 family phage-related lysozyme (muramidase)